MTRYWIGRMLLIALLIGSVFGLKSLWQTISGVRETNCVPFAQKEVPNENDGNWKESSGERLSHRDGTEIRTMRYYKHKALHGLSLGVHSYFGQVVFKGWACNNSERPANSAHPKDREDHMIAVRKDDKWHTAYTQKPDVVIKRDKLGEILAVIITLLDKDGKVVVQRYIERPN